MKKLLHFFVLSLFVISFSGCQKILDRYFPGHGGGGNADNCKITSIAFNELVYTFSYNVEGKLDSIVPNVDINTSEGQLITFSYDSNGRLKQMKRRQNTPYKIDVTHQYGYTGSFITTDTLYDASQLTYRVWLGRLSYDSSGRITSETREIIYSDNENEQPFINLYYFYDANGNLLAQQGAQEITYDDHKSLLRTDKMLQFLARDYSHNNPTGGSVYNASDYPTDFVYTYNFGFYPQEGPTGSVIPVNKVSYECK